MGKSWLTSGNAYGLQDGSTYIKHHDTLTPFVWGGRCWRLEDSSETLGGVTVTTRFDPRGGIERDTVRAEPPGETSGTLVMKRLQADRAKTDLRRCYWDLDQRMQCGGMDRDAWTRWQEITRYCHAKFNERGLAGTAWEGDEDAMVNFPYVALSVDDIYRVAGSENTTVADPITVDIVDVDSCQPQRCPDHCDDQEDCVVAAVTLYDAATYLLTNLAGGDDDNWTATSLAAFTTGTDSADRVLCMGDFVIALSTAHTGIIITHVSSLATQTAVLTPWATNAPACIDGIDQSFIIVGAAAGYIMVSYDAGVNWEEVSSGETTTDALGDIMIARDNPAIIYASSSVDNGSVIKSENGGRTWDATTAVGQGAAVAITSLYVVNQSTVLVGTDAGQVFQTVDGGVTWPEQEDLPLPAGSAKADVTITDITGCGCGVLYLTAMETSIAPRIYRNVDGGAEGRWYRPADIGTLTATTGPAKAIACCGPNHAVAVGGGTTTASSTILIE